MRTPRKGKGGDIVAVYFAWYNFVSIHGSLKVTRAMDAGITDHVWTLNELIGT